MNDGIIKIAVILCFIQCLKVSCAFVKKKALPLPLGRAGLIGLLLFLNILKERKIKILQEAQLIPTAGSPTITLLRLNSSYRPHREKDSRYRFSRVVTLEKKYPSNLI